MIVVLEDQSQQCLLDSGRRVIDDAGAFGKHFLDFHRHGCDRHANCLKLLSQ